LHSYHRSTGRTNWRTELHHARFDESNEQIPVVGGTPACDGQFVYVAAAVHNSLWVTSVDLKGRIAWQHEAGSYWSKSGYHSSPMLFRSLVIVVADQESGSYLTALHRQTGEIIWRVRRPNGHSFSTPIVATIAGRPQLIVGGQSTIISYDPASGERIWTFRGAGRQVLSNLTFDEQHIYAASQKPNSEIVCIKADGTGDVSKSHLVWRHSKIICGRSSPVCHKGLLYLLSDEGGLSCVNAATGTIEWQQRLSGVFTISPVIAGEDLICGSESGRTFIVRTGNSGTVVAENYLEDEITGSPAVVGNAIFVRTRRGLHRISSPTASETVVEKPDSRKRRL
jgi:outer membrane protein assembly factor BamB